VQAREEAGGLSDIAPVVLSLGLAAVSTYYLNKTALDQ